MSLRASVAILFIVAASIAISQPYASAFAPDSFSRRAIRSAAYLVASFVGGTLYNRSAKERITSGVAISLSIVMLGTASIVYSIARQYVVLVVYTSLFSVPGLWFSYVASSITRPLSKLNVTSEQHGACGVS